MMLNGSIPARKKPMNLKNQEPGRFRGVIALALVVFLVPLPFALFMGGTAWIFSGWSQIPKEFVVSYLLGVIGFGGSIALLFVRSKWSDRKNSAAVDR